MNFLYRRKLKTKVKHFVAQLFAELADLWLTFLSCILTYSIRISHGSTLYVF